MEVITNIWREWWWPIRIFMDLLVIAVIMRGILANKILDELKALWRRVVANDRNRAIYSHYQLQARGEGHGSPSVLNCGQDTCAIF